MQETFFNMNQTSLPPAPIDDIARVFNTALVTTRASASADISAELRSLVESPGFRAILSSVRQFARIQGVSEKEAAETIIQLFRKLDRLWGDYVFREGVGKIRDPEK